MSEDFFTNYKDGDIVWVKLGPSWWPGEVKDLNNIPNDEIEFKKPPLAVVKFFEEDTYEYVRSWANIYPYNSEKKAEFIKKGMAAFHSKASHMEKFPKDVVAAEERTGGNSNILSEPEYRTEVKRNYAAEVSGSQNTKKKTSKEAKKSKSQQQRDTSHITHRRFLGCDDYKAYICIQYPGKDRTPGDSEDEEVIRINKEPEHEYNCHSCSYSTKRLEVMILHTKSHIQGNYMSSPKRKRPVMPKPKKKEGTKKQKTPTISRSRDSSSDEVSEPPKEKKRKTKSTISKKATESIEDIKPKKATDICNDLLAEWDDTDDELVLDSTLDMTTTSIEDDNKDETNEVIKNGENVDTCDVDTEITENVDKNDCVEVTDQSNHEEQKSKETSKPTMDEETSKPTMDQETQEAIKSCFDFEEDEEEELLNPTVQEGRKIPRVIPPTEKRKSEILEDIIDLEEGINKDEILKVSQGFNEKKSDNLELENVFKEFMNEVSVPKLPEVKANLKPTQNFHCVKTIKFPDKIDEPPKIDRDKIEADTSSKLINPKKRFVKSFEDFENQLHREEIKRKEEAELQRKIMRENLLKSAKNEQNEDDISNVDIGHLQCTIMSKIIDESNISDESKQTIMSKMHKKKTPRGKILDLYLSDSASTSQSQSTDVDIKEATQVVTLETDDLSVSGTSKDSHIPESHEEENLSIDESDSNKNRINKSPTFLDNTIADDSIPQVPEQEEDAKLASPLDSRVETNLTDPNSIETFKMKINKKLRKRTLNVDEAVVEDRSKYRKTRRSLARSEAKDVLEETVESTNTNYTCFDKHKSTTEQTIRKLSFRLSLPESQTYTTSRDAVENSSSFESEDTDKNKDELSGTKSFNVSENIDTSKRTEPQAMSENVSVEKKVDTDKDENEKTGQITLEKSDNKTESSTSALQTEITEHLPVETEVLKTKTGKPEKIIGQIVRKRSTRHSSKNTIMTKGDTYQNVLDTAITEPLPDETEAVVAEEIVHKHSRKRSSLSVKQASQDNKNENIVDKIENIKGEETEDKTTSESKVSEEVGDKTTHKRSSRRSTGKRGSTSIEKHDIPPQIITAETLTDEIEVAVTKGDGNEVTEKIMPKRSSRQSSTDKISELEAAGGLPEKVVVPEDDKKELITDETDNKQKSLDDIDVVTTKDDNIVRKSKRSSSGKRSIEKHDVLPQIITAETLTDEIEVAVTTGDGNEVTEETVPKISSRQSSTEKICELETAEKVVIADKQIITTKDDNIVDKPRLSLSSKQRKLNVRDRFSEEIRADITKDDEAVDKTEPEECTPVTEITHKHEQTVLDTQSSSEKHGSADEMREEVVPTGDVITDEIASQPLDTEIEASAARDKEIPQRKRGSRHSSSGKYRTLKAKIAEDLFEETFINDDSEEMAAKTTHKRSSRYSSRKHDVLPPANIVGHSSDELEEAVTKVLKHAERTMPKRKCRQSSSEKYSKPETSRDSPVDVEVVVPKDHKNEQIAVNQSLPQTKTDSSEEIADKTSRRRSSRWSEKQNIISTKTTNELSHINKDVEETASSSSISEQNSTQLPSETKIEHLPGLDTDKDKESDVITTKTFKHKHVADRTMPKRSCRKSSAEKHDKTEIAKNESIPDELIMPKDDENEIASKQSSSETKIEVLPQDMDVNVAKEEEIVEKTISKRSSRRKRFSSSEIHELPQTNVVEITPEVADKNLESSSEQHCLLESENTEESVVPKDDVTQQNSSRSSLETKIEHLSDDVDVTTVKDEKTPYKSWRKRISRHSSSQKHHTSKADETNIEIGHKRLSSSEVLTELPQTNVVEHLPEVADKNLESSETECILETANTEYLPAEVEESVVPKEDVTQQNSSRSSLETKIEHLPDDVDVTTVKEGKTPYKSWRKRSTRHSSSGKHHTSKADDNDESNVQIGPKRFSSSEVLTELPQTSVVEHLPEVADKNLESSEKQRLLETANTEHLPTEVEESVVSKDTDVTQLKPCHSSLETKIENLPDDVDVTTVKDEKTPYKSWRKRSTRHSSSGKHHTSKADDNDESNVQIGPKRFSSSEVLTELPQTSVVEHLPEVADKNLQCSAKQSLLETANIDHLPTEVEESVVSKDADVTQLKPCHSSLETKIEHLPDDVDVTTVKDEKTPYKSWRKRSTRHSSSGKHHTSNPDEIKDDNNEAAVKIWRKRFSSSEVHHELPQTNVVEHSSEVADKNLDSSEKECILETANTEVEELIVPKDDVTRQNSSRSSLETKIEHLPDEVDVTTVKYEKITYKNWSKRSSRNSSSGKHQTEKAAESNVKIRDKCFSSSEMLNELPQTNIVEHLPEVADKNLESSSEKHCLVETANTEHLSTEVEELVVPKDDKYIADQIVTQEGSSHSSLETKIDLPDDIDVTTVKDEKTPFKNWRKRTSTRHSSSGKHQTLKADETDVKSAYKRFSPSERLNELPQTNIVEHLPEVADKNLEISSEKHCLVETPNTEHLSAAVEESVVPKDDKYITDQIVTQEGSSHSSLETKIDLPDDIDVTTVKDEKTPFKNWRKRTSTRYSSSGKHQTLKADEIKVDNDETTVRTGRKRFPPSEMHQLPQTNLVEHLSEVTDTKLQSSEQHCVLETANTEVEESVASKDDKYIAVVTQQISSHSSVETKMEHLHDDVGITTVKDKKTPYKNWRKRSSRHSSFGKHHISKADEIKEDNDETAAKIGHKRSSSSELHTELPQTNVVEHLPTEVEESVVSKDDKYIADQIVTEPNSSRSPLETKIDLPDDIDVTTVKDDKIPYKSWCKRISRQSSSRKHHTSKADEIKDDNDETGVKIGHKRFSSSEVHTELPQTNIVEHLPEVADKTRQSSEQHCLLETANTEHLSTEVEVVSKDDTYIADQTVTQQDSSHSSLETKTEHLTDDVDVTTVKDEKTPYKSWRIRSSRHSSFGKHHISKADEIKEDNDETAARIGHERFSSSEVHTELSQTNIVEHLPEIADKNLQSSEQHCLSETANTEHLPTEVEESSVVPKDDKYIAVQNVTHETKIEHITDDVDVTTVKDEKTSYKNWRKRISKHSLSGKHLSLKADEIKDDNDETGIKIGHKRLSSSEVHAELPQTNIVEHLPEVADKNLQSSEQHCLVTENTQQLPTEVEESVVSKDDKYIADQIVTQQDSSHSSLETKIDHLTDDIDITTVKDENIPYKSWRKRTSRHSSSGKYHTSKADEIKDIVETAVKIGHKRFSSSEVNTELPRTNIVEHLPEVADTNLQSSEQHCLLETANTEHLPTEVICKNDADQIVTQQDSSHSSLETKIEHLPDDVDVTTVNDEKIPYKNWRKRSSRHSSSRKHLSLKADEIKGDNDETTVKIGQKRFSSSEVHTELPQTTVVEHLPEVDDNNLQSSEQSYLLETANTEHLSTELAVVSKDDTYIADQTVTQQDPSHSSLETKIEHLSDDIDVTTVKDDKTPYKNWRKRSFRHSSSGKHETLKADEIKDNNDETSVKIGHKHFSSSEMHVLPQTNVPEVTDTNLESSEKRLLETAKTEHLPTEVEESVVPKVDKHIPDQIVTQASSQSSLETKIYLSEDIDVTTIKDEKIPYKNWRKRSSRQFFEKHRALKAKVTTYLSDEIKDIADETGGKKSSPPEKYDSPQAECLPNKIEEVVAPNDHENEQIADALNSSQSDEVGVPTTNDEAITDKNLCALEPKKANLLSLEIQDYDETITSEKDSSLPSQDNVTEPDKKDVTMAKSIDEKLEDTTNCEKQHIIESAIDLPVKVDDTVVDIDNKDEKIAAVIPSRSETKLDEVVIPTVDKNEEYSTSELNVMEHVSDKLEQLVTTVGTSKEIENKTSSETHNLEETELKGINLERKETVVTEDTDKSKTETLVQITSLPEMQDLSSKAQIESKDEKQEVKVEDYSSKKSRFKGKFRHLSRKAYESLDTKVDAIHKEDKDTEDQRETHFEQSDADKTTVNEQKNSSTANVMTVKTTEDDNTPKNAEQTSVQQKIIDIKQTNEDKISLEVPQIADTSHSFDKLQETKIDKCKEEDNKGSDISETKQESIDIKASSFQVQKPTSVLKESPSDTSEKRAVSSAFVENKTGIIATLENREKLRLPFKKGRWSIRSHPKSYRSTADMISPFQISSSQKIIPHSQSSQSKSSIDFTKKTGTLERGIETGEGSKHKSIVKDNFTENKSETTSKNISSEDKSEITKYISSEIKDISSKEKSEITKDVFSKIKDVPSEDKSVIKDILSEGKSKKEEKLPNLEDTSEELTATGDEIKLTETDNQIVENMEHPKFEDIPANDGKLIEKIDEVDNAEKSQDVVVTQPNTETEQTISDSFINIDNQSISEPKCTSDSESTKIDETKQIRHENISNFDHPDKVVLGLNTSQFSVLCSQNEEFSVGNTSLELPEDAIYEPLTLSKESYKKKNDEEKTIATNESILTESITKDNLQPFNQDSTIVTVEEETIFEVTIEEDSIHNEEKLEDPFVESKNAEPIVTDVIKESIVSETEESTRGQVEPTSLAESEVTQESLTMEGPDISNEKESKETYKTAKESILTEEVVTHDQISTKEQTDLFDSTSMFSYDCSKDSNKKRQNDFEEYRTKIGNLLESSMHDRKSNDTDSTVSDRYKGNSESKKCITFDMPADDDDEKLTDLVSDIVQKLNQDESDKNQEDLDMELEEEMHLISKSHKKIAVASMQPPIEMPKQEGSDTTKEAEEKNLDMSNQEEKISNEVEIFCAGNSNDSFKFCIQTNLSNLSRSEEISAIALATLSEIKTDVEVISNTTEEIAPKVDLPSPEKLSDTEMAAIEGNLTVMSEKDLADAQVEITSEKVISSKKPIMLSSFSMDFSEPTSTNSGKTISEGPSEPRKHKEIDSKGTEFTSRAITKEFKPKILSKKINTYNQCELLNILEGNSDSEKKVMEFQTQAKSFTGDICDFEEHIPSQIVCTKQFKQDLDDEFKKKDKSSVISTASKLLERLSEIKTDPKKETPSETVTKNIKQKPKLKPIILSEQIIKPASDPKKIIPPSNSLVNDIEDVEAFIIRKDIKKPVEVGETVETAKSVRKPRQKTLGKANILHETIITPAGEIIQPAANQQMIKAVLVNAPASSTTTRTPADSPLESNKTSKSAAPAEAVSQDDNVFDIFNMPIVLSDQILTPESIENMPIVIENNTPVNKPKQLTPPTQPTKTIPNKVLTKVVATGKSTVISTRSTNVLPKFTKPRLLQTATKPGLSVSPNILSRSKPGKYILVSQGSGTAQQPKKTIIKKTSLPGNLPSKITGTPEGVGHKIMVVTNQQGQQQRLLLTPAQQKVLGYQSPIGPKLDKPVVKPDMVQKVVTTPAVKPDISTIKSTISQKIITTAGQIITGTTTPRPNKSVVKRTSSSLPSQKVTSAKTTKTILITNKHGQTIKKIATTEDDIDKQVAEQLEAIKASSGMHFSSQSKSDSVPHKLLQKSPVRKSYNRKPDPKLKTVPVSTKSDTSSNTILPASTSRKVTPQIPETKKVVQEEPKPQLDRPLNQLVIQDALGNQTTITEGQILALPSETVDGQPQSYMLVTLDQTGNLTPLNNEALMSLDPNLGLGGDLSNIVLQIDQGALGAGNINQPTPLAQPATVKITNPGEELRAGTSKIEIPRETVPLSLPVANEVPVVEQKIEENMMVAPTEAAVNIVSNSNGEQGQQLIVTGDPIATQKFLESLSEGTTDLANIIANAEGKSILIQTDGQQILINTNTDSQMLTNIVESTEGNGNPVFATQPNKNTDILAAALADTDVFPTQSKVASQLSPNHALYPINVGNVLETSLTLNSPIMTPLEVPSSNNKKIPDDEADILIQVPKNVDLPITITDPNISQTVANQQVATLIGNEFQANLELGLSLPEATIAAVSTGLNSPGYNYSLSTLDDNDISHKSFNSSMPLLNDDVDDSLTGKKSEKDDHKSQQHISAGSFLVEESRFTLGGSMCSSLSEPPPEMFDIPDNGFGEKNSNNIPLSLQSTPDPKDDDGSIQTESSSEGSCEIPLQPKIVAKSADLHDVDDI